MKPVMYGNPGSFMDDLRKEVGLELTPQDDLKPSDVCKSDDPIVMFGVCPQKMEIVRECWKIKRPFYTIDAGYVGNVVGPAQVKHPPSMKTWWRFVPNELQHTKFDPPPPYSREHIEKVGIQPVHVDRGDRVLVVLPGPIAACYYGLDLDTLQESIRNEIKKHTDRKVVFREKDPGGKKAGAKQRMRTNQFWKRLYKGDIHCTVTWGSVASVESVLYGIPSIPLNPCAASHVCSSDLSEIENPKYPEAAEKYDWLEWLCRESFKRDEIVQKVKDLI